MTDEGVLRFDIQIAVPWFGLIAAHRGALAQEIANQREVSSDVWS